jgi:hypothetical protein
LSQPVQKGEWSPPLFFIHLRSPVGSSKNSEGDLAGYSWSEHGEDVPVGPRHAGRVRVITAFIRIIWISSTQCQSSNPSVN